MKYTSLSQFYNSSEWKNFRAGLIASRINPADGVLYDEFSGAPIIKAYDIIAHHKIELTVENVNDRSISLNPDNIMLVSHRSHDEIHKRFGFTAYRKVYYIYGPPCSGKTSYVRRVKGNSDIVADTDNIWEALVGTRYYKPAALKDIVFDLRSRLMDDIRRRAARWERAYVIAGGAVKGIRDKEIEYLQAEPIFIDESIDVCLERLANDNTRTDKAMHERFIREWFDDFTD